MNAEKRAGDQQQQQQKSGRPELTAEWTVHAQLTISRPDGTASGPSGSEDRANPVRVVYKWCSDNLKEENSQATDSTLKDQHDSFHSTTTTEKLPSDSGHSSSNISRKPFGGGGARCKSTCSIVLSAVADFSPATSDIPEEPDPFYFHTTSSYDIPANQPGDESNPQNFGATKILSLRDAFSQTSDTETRQQHQLPDSRKRFPYDYRRVTESMQPPPVVEGETNLPSSYSKNSPQTSRNFGETATAVSGIPASVAASQKSDGAKKPPRTVHIDVYCTGSDAEDDDDDEDDVDGDASSRSSSNNLNDIESNSTPQTVLNTEQMLLRHQRAGMADLPRRLVTQPLPSQKQHNYKKTNEAAATHGDFPDSSLASISPPQHLGHVLSQSNTADEISESKQILFKKHIGDQRSGKYNFRNRNFRRDQSDDAISSNYPNSSSRSTMRDMTCSSISSAMASTTSAAYDDHDESSWKETEPEPEHELADMIPTNLGKSDSFEYENSIDRHRIHRMDRIWSPQSGAMGPHDPSSVGGKLNAHQQKRIQDFLQSYRNPLQQRFYHDPYASQHDDPVAAGGPHRGPLYNRTTIPERDEPIDQPAPVAHSHRLTLRPGLSQDSATAHQETIAEPPSKVLFNTEYVKSGSETSTLLSNISGYTNEYLQKARRFGAVVTALRKPGHHIGPSKNPDCQCEHCKRWMAERVQGRGRTYSAGDSPYLRTSFWLRRSTPGM